MGMPQIPDGTNRPSLEEVIIDLFESIALEEMAISHILNAEGEKLQSIVCGFKNNALDICQLINVTNSAHQIVSDLIIKEWLLLNKFNNIKEFSNNLKNTCSSCCYYTNNNCNTKCN